MLALTVTFALLALMPVVLIGPVQYRGLVLQVRGALPRHRWSDLMLDAPLRGFEAAAGPANQGRARDAVELERTESLDFGGGGGIRTHGGVAPSLVFKTSALNRSATPPAKNFRTRRNNPVGHLLRRRSSLSQTMSCSARAGGAKSRRPPQVFHGRRGSLQPSLSGSRTLRSSTCASLLIRLTSSSQ